MIIGIYRPVPGLARIAIHYFQILVPKCRDVCIVTESTYLDLCSELSWANDGAPCQCRQYGPAYERCIFAIRIDPAALVSTSAVFLTRAEAQEIGTDESNIAARGMRNKDDKIIARVGASVLPISLTDLINAHRTLIWLLHSYVGPSHHSSVSYLPAMQPHIRQEQPRSIGPQVQECKPCVTTFSNLDPRRSVIRAGDNYAEPRIRCKAPAVDQTRRRILSKEAQERLPTYGAQYNHYPVIWLPI